MEMGSKEMVECVINIFGGPGVGKSTVASGLFYFLKIKHYDVEIISEYAKQLTYEERWDILKQDQLTILAKQHSKLRVVAKHRRLVVVDSPLLLSKVYFNPKTNITDASLFLPLVVQMFNAYPNYNILLRRNPELPYEEAGRYQTLDEAKDIDNKVKKFLDSYNIPYWEILADESAPLLIMDNMKKKGLL